MITLRKIDPSDLPYLYQWDNDASSWADSDTANPLSKQDLKDYIESTTGDIYKDGQLRLVIMADEMTIGSVELFHLDARNSKVEVGIYIAPDFRGKGYATEALKKVEDYVYGFLHLKLIYAFTRFRNVASARLFSKRAFEPSSVLRHWTAEGDGLLWLKYKNL